MPRSKKFIKWYRSLTDADREAYNLERENARRLKNQRNSERMKKRWATMTDEERSAQIAKAHEGRANPKPKVAVNKPGEHNRKLTEDQVCQIWHFRGSRKEAAEMFGVSVATVVRIWKRETWSYLDLPLVKRRDYRRKTKKVVKLTPESLPPLLTADQEAAILSMKFEDTKTVADKLGIHWMLVATFRRRAA